MTNAESLGLRSVFASDLAEFITLKQSLGYKYSEAAEYHAKRFDKFIYSKGIQTKNIPKDILIEYFKKTAWEKNGTRKTRISFIRQFTLYLQSREIANIWIPPLMYGGRTEDYIPFIFTKDQLRDLLRCSEYITFKPSMPLWHLAFPVMIRLLISCGLRSSEVCKLRLSDIDLYNNCLEIRNSKNGNNRYVPFDDTIKSILSAYIQQIDYGNGTDYYAFPYRLGTHATNSQLYSQFRLALQTAGIHHTGDGPRVHDLRHTFAVLKLKEWVENEEDLVIMLPFLRVYMGHATFEETAYYLRMTADCFPIVRKLLEPTSQQIFAEIMASDFIDDEAYETY